MDFTRSLYSQGIDEWNVHSHGNGDFVRSIFNPQLTMQSSQIYSGLPTVSRDQNPNSLVTQPELSQSIATSSSPSHTTPVAVEPPRGGSRRSKYQHLKWNLHKNTIRRIYLEEDRSLAETMSYMKKKHSFEASIKLYKEKFKEWKWQKNLPSDYAQWMVAKAKKRKREDNKDTLFNYGGLQWTEHRAESSATRSKKAMSNPEPIYVDTPAEINYITPIETRDAITPESVVLFQDAENNSTKVLEMEDTEPYETNGGEEVLRSTYKGYSRTDLNKMLELAKQLRLDHEFSKAEHLLCEVFQGFNKLLSPTHEITNEVGYSLASLYNEQKRTEDANYIIEDMSRKHIQRWGMEHHRTRQHILHAVELLDSWNRSADAPTFLARAWDVVCESKSASQKKEKENRPRRIIQSLTTANRQDIIETTQGGTNDPISAKADATIGMTRAYVEPNDKSVENFLQASLHLCENNLEDLTIQSLKARAELLRLYFKLDLTDDRRGEFESARDSIKVVWECYNWEKESFRNLDCLEASVEVITALLKANYLDEAKELFRQVVDKANDVFGRKDEKTIWLCIAIGLVFQSEMNWNEAQPWFVQALSAATSKYNADDGIILSLERALEKKHFSYLTDEGRPFKSLFGVTGIILRPNRP